MSGDPTTHPSVTAEHSLHVRRDPWVNSVTYSFNVSRLRTKHKRIQFLVPVAMTGQVGHSLGGALAELECMSILTFNCKGAGYSAGIFGRDIWAYLPTLVPVEVSEPRAKEWFRSLLSGVNFLHPATRKLTQPTPEVKAQAGDESDKSEQNVGLPDCPVNATLTMSKGKVEQREARRQRKSQPVSGQPGSSLQVVVGDTQCLQATEGSP
ncbi:uncharacterized protein EDB91DRAFT_1089943 [Suillus paluster]|uniref:uncharacterized protein n=1 Tax=Suillus paluster TaxID=48578 RepID=UPI001B884E53|nr:uncharacterized protein EDB91DRAFT_1089943 [Suillus paluster]KAG1718616.1 hypothetical protein EDB91DRAFT_1089943 [Suillus paluster]